MAPPPFLPPPHGPEGRGEGGEKNLSGAVRGALGPSYRPRKPPNEKWTKHYQRSVLDSIDGPLGRGEGIFRQRWGQARPPEAASPAHKEVKSATDKHSPGS